MTVNFSAFAHQMEVLSDRLRDVQNSDMVTEIRQKFTACINRFITFLENRGRKRHKKSLYAGYRALAYLVPENKKKKD
jgi:hypothetical protein